MLDRSAAAYSCEVFPKRPLGFLKCSVLTKCGLGTDLITLCWQPTVVL